ncbi:MAG: glycine cleavage T C-terminal barrel domain-containing protein [Myxococcota bacterium]|nr:glycine cleavage T C-terminal barrel domain-containing protein [Myxococcota bacterium]
MNEARQAPSISIGPRVRKSPYFDSTLRYGAKAFTVYNHMYMPTSYSDPISEYRALVEGVTLWDVACERQVEISGSDATRFTQLLTPRNLSRCAVNQCMYVLITDSNGGIVNDAVLLRLEENRYWLSPGDGDVLLWAQGVAATSGLDVEVTEPDVSPMQLQGPLAPQVAEKLFGQLAYDLGYYRMQATTLGSIPLVLSRTGWSGELGYELFLQDSRHGDELWEKVAEAGREFEIAPIAPSAIRSIEGGILSYVSDIQRLDDPFTLGMDRLVDLDMEADFIGKEALRKIKSSGTRRKLVGVEIEGEPIAGNDEFWSVLQHSKRVGYITRCAFSPRLEKNIGFANIPTELAQPGEKIEVETKTGTRGAVIVSTPWFHSLKKIVRPS